MEMPHLTLGSPPLPATTGPRPAPSAPAAPALPGEPASFGHALQEAVGKLEGLQQSADQQSQAVARGNGNLHETAIALEKADIAMRVATRVRNKLVEAYQEVMRMNV